MGPKYFFKGSDAAYMIDECFAFSFYLGKVMLQGENMKCVFVSFDESLIFQQIDAEITFYNYNSVPFCIYIALLRISSSFSSRSYISAYLN